MHILCWHMQYILVKKYFTPQTICSARNICRREDLSLHLKTNAPALPKGNYIPQSEKLSQTWLVCAATDHDMRASSHSSVLP